MLVPHVSDDFPTIVFWFQYKQVGEGVTERMEDAIASTDDRLAMRLEKEKAASDLPADFPSKARGALMHDMRQGYVFRTRAGATPKQLLADLDDRVRLILS